MFYVEFNGMIYFTSPLRVLHIHHIVIEIHLFDPFVFHSSKCLIKEGDKVLRLSTAYGMVIETTDWLARTANIEIIVAQVLFPVKDSSQLLASFTECLQKNPDVKLCCLSNISSKHLSWIRKNHLDPPGSGSATQILHKRGEQRLAGTLKSWTLTVKP